MAASLGPRAPSGRRSFGAARELHVSERTTGVKPSGGEMATNGQKWARCPVSSVDDETPWRINWLVCRHSHSQSAKPVCERR